MENPAGHLGTARQSVLTKILKWGGAGLIVAGLSGCAGVHLYNEEKDKSAKDIETKYQAIALKDVFKKEDENLQAIYIDEIAVVRAMSTLNRDQMLYALAESASGKTVGVLAGISNDLTPATLPIPNDVEEQAKLLGVVDKAVLSRLVTVKAQIPNGFQTLVRDQNFRSFSGLIKLKKIGWKIKQCAEIEQKPGTEIADELNLAGATKDQFAKSYDLYAEACAPFSPLVPKILFLHKTKALGDGSIMATARSIKQLDQIVDSFEDQKEKLKCELSAIDPQPVRGTSDAEKKKSRKKIVKAAQNCDTKFPNAALNIENAVSAALDAAAQSEKDAKSFFAELKEKSKKASDVLKGVASGASDIGLTGASTKERLEALGVILDAVAAGEVGDDVKKALESNPTLLRAAIVTGSISRFGEKIESILKNLDKPAIRADLMIEQQHQRLKLDFANTRLALLKRQKSIREEQLNVLLRKAKYLSDLDGLMADKKDVTGNIFEYGIGGETAQQILDAKGKDKAKINQKKRALYLTVLYLDHLYRADSRTEELNYEYNHVTHLRANLTNRYAALAWDNLIRVPVQQLAAYYGSGVRPEKISQFIAALSSIGLLGFVAVEAN